MHIFVTGASGFIGKYLCRELLQYGHALTLFVRPTSDVSFLERHPSARLAYGDILDPDSLRKAIPAGCDMCFHCAAAVEEGSARKLHAVNVVGTENVFAACLQQGINRIVHVSSVAVISGNPEVPLTDGLPYAATNRYGQSKIEAEKIALSYRFRGLHVAIFRPSMVYGEEEPHLQRFIMGLLKMRCLFLVGPAECKWHLAYVRNVVAALLLALHHERAFSGTYLVADPEVLTVKEVFCAFADGLSVADPLSLPSWMGSFLGMLPLIGKKVRFFNKDRVYDISRLRSLGYRPHFTAQEALRKTAAYYRR